MHCSVHSLFLFILSFIQAHCYSVTAGDLFIHQEKRITQAYTEHDSNLLLNKSESINDSEEMGIGIFKPNFFQKPVLFFYGRPNLEKPIQDHSPQDSMVFYQEFEGGIGIRTAPPWLVPEYLKMDYEIALFKVIGLSHNFLEVEVNKTNGQTMHVSRQAGEFLSWPEFLMQTNTLELLDPAVQRVRVKPLDYAGEQPMSYRYLQALEVRDEWMFVALLNSDFQQIGKGWIQWKSGGKWLIRYSMLS